MSWARDDALHLTVRFFMEIDDERVVALEQALGDGLAACTPVAIPIARVGGFPRFAAPRVLWAGPPEGWMEAAEGVRLGRIAAVVDRACDALGLPNEDRRWSPHITLARVKDGERLVGNAIRTLAAPDPAPVLEATSITLYRSDLTPQGARHTAVWTVVFGPRSR